MSIVRKAKRRSNFTTISNEAPQNPALSYRAVGLWTYLMTKPDHWKAKVSHLAEQHTEGREAVRAALVELEGAGYVVRRWVRRPGSATPTREYVVYETLDEAREDQAEGGTESADSLGCEHSVGLPRNPSSRPGEGSRHDGFSGTQEPAASKYSERANTDSSSSSPLVRPAPSPVEEEQPITEADLSTDIDLSPAACVCDEDIDQADVPDATVLDLSERLLAARLRSQPVDPVLDEESWLRKARKRIRQDQHMPRAAHAVRHPSMGRMGDRDRELDALAHVHRRRGAWPDDRPAPRRRIAIAAEVSTDVDSSGERAPMPSSVRDALKGART